MQKRNFVSATKVIKDAVKSYGDLPFYSKFHFFSNSLTPSHLEISTWNVHRSSNDMLSRRLYYRFFNFLVIVKLCVFKGKRHIRTTHDSFNNKILAILSTAYCCNLVHMTLGYWTLRCKKKIQIEMWNVIKFQLPIFGQTLIQIYDCVASCIGLYI